MNSHFYHVQLNVDFANLPFYKELMSFLGWDVIFEMEEVIGFKSGMTGDVWFVDADKKEKTDYDKLGMNHLSIRVKAQQDVDDIAKFLKKKEIEMKFDTPRHRPEFTSSEDQTYYQIMFESPDGILFEIVFIGEK